MQVSFGILVMRCRLAETIIQHCNFNLSCQLHCRAAARSGLSVVWATMAKMRCSSSSNGGMQVSYLDPSLTHLRQSSSMASRQYDSHSFVGKLVPDCGRSDSYRK